MNIVLQSIILAVSKEDTQLKKSDRWQPCPAKHKARRRDTAGEKIISIYYYAKALEPITAPIRLKEFDFDEAQLRVYEKENEIETFRFIDWDIFTLDNVTLPIDKFVVNMLKGYC